MSGDPVCNRRHGASHGNTHGQHGRMMHHRSQRTRPALLPADELVMNSFPMLRQICRPCLSRRWQHLNDLPRPRRRPGHSLASERLDISARIAHGQHAMAAEIFAPARQHARAAKPRRF